MLSTPRALATSILFLAASALPAEAQKLEPRPVPARPVESFTFQSPSMGVRFAVNVGLPPGYKAGAATKYPALVTTDGDWAFDAVEVGARSLAGTIEPLFIVSIGTASEDGEEEWTRRRIYEFSTTWDMKDPFGRGVLQYCERFHSAPGRCVGGAPKFLNAIVAELIPMIAAKYPIDTTRLGLFGVSAGGFFTSWAIFQANSPFKKYLISSPAMAYGDGEVFRQEERYAAEHKDLAVGIYLGAGVLETGDGFLEGVGKIVSGMSHLAGVLGGRNYPGLKLTTEYHPGLSHTDVLGTTVARGLRVLYSK